MQQCMGCMEQMEDLLTICPHCGYEKGTPPKEAYHMPPESILASRYIVGRVLGYGGFGVTYIGWDAQLLRKVAIKEFLPSSFATRMPGYTEITVYGGEATLQFEAGLSRFTDEARRLAAFNSIPGIVDIYDTFVENNTAYIVMQFLQGRDVKAILAEKGSYTFEEALPIIVEICNTLEPVHKAEIIHRDIAPDNIYITKKGEVKLLDFGASRFATSVNSKSLSVILKSGYAPEEQYRSRGDQGPWSDVYALAATFYKMLTGVTPEDSMERAIRDELKEPSQLGAELPKDAENAIMNALNIRKENRIQTVAEFRRALTGDKVNRVKEKAVRSDSGALPLWGKLLIAGALVLTLGFGLLTVTGVLDFGQGNLLADTFGSGIPEGFVNAPGVVNQMETRARKSANKAGLTYLIVGTQYSDDIEKGRILSQEPLPGRLIEKGKELQVNISGGSREEAMAAGEMKLPDLTYMTVAEASYQISQAGYHGANVFYNYSDTIAEGLVISYEEGYVTTLTVSAGKNDADQKAGQMRAPALYVRWDGMTVLSFAVASAKTTEGNDQERILHLISYSSDHGASWNLMDGFDLYDNYDTNEWRPVPVQEIVLDNLIRHEYPELLGKEIRFRVERIWAEDYYAGGFNSGDLPILDRIEFDQRLKPVSGGEEPKITMVREMTWEEVGELLSGEESFQKTRFGSQYQWRINEGREEMFDSLIPYLLEGDFKKGKTYTIATGVGNLLEYPITESCGKDGFLMFEEHNYGRLGGEVTFIVSEIGEAEVSENGDIETAIHPFTESLWKNGEEQISVQGKQVRTVINRIMKEDLYLYPTYLFSQRQKEGEVVSYIADINAPEIAVSMGSEGESGKWIRAPFLLRNYVSQFRFLAGVYPLPEEGKGMELLLLTAGSDRNYRELASSYFTADSYPGGNNGVCVQELYTGLKEIQEKNGNPGSPLYFRLQLKDENGNILEERDLEQTVTIHETLPAPAADSVQRLQREEFVSLAEEGRITNLNRYLYINYENIINNPETKWDDEYYLVRGNFKAGNHYKIQSYWEGGGISSGAGRYCERDGELILTLSSDNQSYVLVGIGISLENAFIDENGNYELTVSDETDIFSLLKR